MKKYIVLFLLAVILFVAYQTKPDDKTCIIETVKAVWGDRTPDLKMPFLYEQFMDATSKSVVIDDWIFLKRMKYKYADKTRTVALGMFNKVITN